MTIIQSSEKTETWQINKINMIVIQIRFSFRYIDQYLDPTVMTPDPDLTINGIRIQSLQS